MPKTNISLSRKRAASRVKSLSELTMTKPLSLPRYKRSIASMISEESEAFLPEALLYCCTG